MLYEEFKNLTDQLATFEEYEEINAIYMATTRITRKDCVAIWNDRYGNERRKEIARNKKAVKSLRKDILDSFNDFPKPEHVMKALNEAEQGLRNNYRSDPWKDHWVNEIGLIFKRVKIGMTPNHCYEIYEIHMHMGNGNFEFTGKIYY